MSTPKFCAHCRFWWKSEEKWSFWSEIGAKWINGKDDENEELKMKNGAAKEGAKC